MFCQTTLLKFSNSLPEPNFTSVLRNIEKRQQINSNTHYHYELNPLNILEIKEKYCLTCGKRLYKNGYNKKHLNFNYGIGDIPISVHRKRCVSCGEISIDFNTAFKMDTHNQQNLKKRTRQLYSNGLRYKQIVNVLKICYNIKISKSQVYKWVTEIKEKLRKFLENVKIPSSGYIGYDEIYLKIKGEKRYLMTTIDLNTHFIPATMVVDNKDSSTAKKMLTNAKKSMDTKLLGIVKDCSPIFGGLFTMRGWNHIKLQDCTTHVKWIITKHVKAFAGLSEQSTKPLPKEWTRLLGRFYRVINSRHQASAYVNLEVLRYTVERFTGEKAKHLKIAFDFIESHFNNLQPWKSDYNLHYTNNLLEGSHKKFEYNPEFKTGMKEKSGAQFIADLTVFHHNLMLFSDYLSELKQTREKVPFIEDQSDEKMIFSRQKMQLTLAIRRITDLYEKYQLFWGEYFQILSN